MRRLSAAIFGMLFLSGCSHFENIAHDTRYVETKEFSHILGLGHAQMNLNCKGGVALLEEGQTSIQRVLTVLTLSIYQPKTVRVFCKKSRS